MNLQDLENEISTVQFNNLPRLIKSYVPIIIDIISTDEMKKLKIVDEDKFFEVIEDKVPKFANKFPFLLQKIIDTPDDLSTLDFFLNKISENNTSIKQKTQDVVDYISENRNK